MKKPYVIIPVFVFLVIAVWLWKTNISNDEIISVVKVQQVAYSFTLQNKTNKLLKDRELWVYAPVEKNSYQSCINIESNIPNTKLNFNGINQILKFKFNELPPFANRVINIKVLLEYYSQPIKTDIGNNPHFLLPEAFIESNHPDIVQLAEELKAQTPLETARNIYNWVSLNIDYSGYAKNTRGALYALNYKKGDCTEFMSLFVALCRANDIPARGVGGYTCTANCILSPSTYHNWAEFYIDGIWLMADCQKRVFIRGSSNYIAMQIIVDNETNPMNGYSRFRYKGTGLKIKMN